MPARQYPVLIHHDRDSDAYAASFVDFPVHGTGGSVEECLADAEEIMADVLPDFMSDGQALPDPTPVADIPAKDRKGAVISLVRVNVPGRAKRLSITLDEDLVQAIDAVAPNRSAFLAEAARARLAE